MNDSERQLPEKLAEIAQRHGPDALAHIQAYTDAGFRGLYNGETWDDIARRKGLSPGADIIGWMYEPEIQLNIDVIQLTEQWMKDVQTTSWEQCCHIKYAAGVHIRQRILASGGRLPEDYPTPPCHIKDLPPEDHFRFN